MKMKRVGLLIVLTLIGCNDPSTPDRVKNTVDAASYAAELEKCFDQAVAEVQAGESNYTVNHNYEECAKRVDEKFGRTP